MKDATEEALRAVIAKDEPAYRAALETLQPGAGPHGRTTLTIYLSKTAKQIRILKDPDHGPLDDLHRWVEGEHAITLNWGPDFTARFTAEEAAISVEPVQGYGCRAPERRGCVRARISGTAHALLFQRTAGRHRHRVVHCRLARLVRRTPGKAGRAGTMLCPKNHLIKYLGFIRCARPHGLVRP